MTFTIEMLPAQQGDALWVEYGDGTATFRVLIDGGTSPTENVLRQRITELDPNDRRFELLIVTHVDTDHIGGILRLLADPPEGLEFGDIWFNGWPHLPGNERDSRLGPIDGEILNLLLDPPAGSLQGRSWNAAFRGGPVVVRDRGRLPSRTLADGMKLTLLSPAREQLKKLKRDWTSVIRDAKLSEAEIMERVATAARRKGVDLPLGAKANALIAAASDRFTSDSAPANASSIAVLAEYGDVRCLFGADAYAGVLETALKRLLRERDLDRLSLAAFKLPHHGSRANISNPVLSMLRCDRYLFSTSGAIFEHPDREAVARVLASHGPGSTLYFNYSRPTTRIWDDPELMSDPRIAYTPVYPNGDAGLRIELGGSHD